MGDGVRAALGRADLPAAGFAAGERDRCDPAAWAALERAGVVAETTPAESAECDGCPSRHVEPVVRVDVPGFPSRWFVRCGEHGRVEVRPDRLRRWVVRPAALAELVAASLGAAGGVSELAAGRVWRVGTFRSAGKAWVGFLAVGTARPDAAGVVAAVPELRAANAVVFVPAVVPPAGAWAPAAPVVIPLADVLAVGDRGFALDRLALDSALTPAGEPLPPPAAAFPTPPGATWEEVELTVDDLHLGVRVRGVARRFDFAEAGFEDARTQTPDRGWELLRTLARSGGVLDSPDRIRTKSARLKQGVSVIRHHLRALLALDGDPFHTTGRCEPYRARFRVRSTAGVVYPTPPGAAWVHVTLAGVGADLVVSVEGGPDEPVRFTVADLGLSAAGRNALAAVLRGEPVPRPATDPGMLDLGAALTRLLGIADPPFEFEFARGVWTTRFEVATLGPG